MKKILLVLLLLCFRAFAEEPQSLNPDLVKKLHDLKKAEPIEIPIIKDSAIEKKVSDFEKDGMPELLDSVKTWKSKLTEGFGYDEPEETCYEQKNLGDIELYVFISSSMPEETLRYYASQLKNIPPATMVLNGTVGSISYIMPTVNLLTRISCGKNVDELKEENVDCMIVRTDLNPYLFRTFSIKAVPAFVMSKKPYSEIMMMASKGEKLSENDFLKLSGDTTLEYVLEHFKAAGADSAATLIEMLRSDGYYR
ncbi:MAG: TrbC family F-type conjugative pilus assembly protein [Deferribacterales bacterium]